MLNIAIIFLIFAIVAAIFGFGGTTRAPEAGGMIFFAIFLVMAFLAFVM